MANVRIVDVVKNGQPQAIGNSQTSVAVSNIFQLQLEDTLNFGMQITTTTVSGTGGTLKLQQSADGTNFTDIDATNFKVTIAGAGRSLLNIGCTNSTYAPKLPVFKFMRVVATTGGSDAFTVTSILFQGAVPTT